MLPRLVSKLNERCQQPRCWWFLGFLTTDLGIIYIGLHLAKYRTIPLCWGVCSGSTIMY
ncbi:hypothetical protein BJX68DRAFT_231098, partial [Aspergillus pseudodeflectus]